MTDPVNLNFPGKTGTHSLSIHAGQPVFLLGRNGTGKSALIHFFVTQIAHRMDLNWRYIPGSRPSYFDADSLNMTPSSRLQLEQNGRSWDSQPEMRVRPISGAIRNERAIYDLQAAELQFKVDAANQIAADDGTDVAIFRLRSNTSPLSRVNRLLRQSNLPVQMVIDGAEIRAERDSAIYSIAKMSDGERIALLIIADVISLKPGSFVLIDEPELHLHPAIVIPLIAALISERPDCAMAISTHELGLPSAVENAKILLVRSCSWQKPSIGTWDIDFIDTIEGIPEGLRVDILGSRRKLLFVEGTDRSLDQPLYSLLFPDVSIRSRRTCIDVHRAVAGLKADDSIHHVKAFGLVDNDGMSQARIDALADSGVYALPMFSVEALYYAPEVVKAVAERQAGTFSLSAPGLLNSAENAALDSLQEEHLKHLSARLAERTIRERVLRQLPTRADLISNGKCVMEVSVESPYQKVFDALKDLVQKRDLAEIIRAYPVRETRVLKALTAGLRFQECSHYEQAALSAIDSDKALRDLLRGRLAKLAEAIDSV